MSSTKYYELTNPQKRIWFTEVMHNHLEMSNIGYLIHFKGQYDLNLLAKAVKYVVKANDSLLLRFKLTGDEKGEPVQFIPAYEEVDVQIIETASEEELLKKIENIHRERFAVDARFHCSFVVFSIGKKICGFFEKAHHMVADGISAIIVAREVIETYHELVNNDFKEIDKGISYLDFVRAEKEYIGSEKYIKDREYWVRRFDDFEGEEITFSLNKNKKNSLEVKRLSLQVPGDIIRLLEAYKAENRIANFALFMAALAIYFNRFMNHQDIVIGMPVHNRAGKLFKQMVGMFVSTLPFRIKF